MKEPPLVLVRTWYELLVQKENKEASAHAEQMLMGAFGNHQAIADYLKKHMIIE